MTVGQNKIEGVGVLNSATIIPQDFNKTRRLEVSSEYEVLIDARSKSHPGSSGEEVLQDGKSSI